MGNFKTDIDLAIYQIKLFAIILFCPCGVGLEFHHPLSSSRVECNVGDGLATYHCNITFCQSLIPTFLLKVALERFMWAHAYPFWE
jgi:hypothetical protein